MRALSRITCERGLPRRVGGPNARLPVCADQRIRTFTALAAHTDALVLPDTISLGAFADHIDDANAVPTVAAIIVQTRPRPGPARLLAVLDRVDPPMTSTPSASTRPTRPARPRTASSPNLPRPGHPSGDRRRRAKPAE